MSKNEESVAKCLREAENWGKMDAVHKFDNPSFDPVVVARDMAGASPKLAKLIETIKALDAEDIQTHGHLFKHFIYSDVKSAYGAKLIASGLAASGFTHAYGLEKTSRGMSFKLRPTTSSNKSLVFATLTSVLFFEKPVGVNFRKELLARYNARPANNHGDDIRIIILDSGFREGVDLFDIKYVHLFEPITTHADQKQAIGRATRFCGQKGLQFHTKKGWPIYVHRYHTTITLAVRTFLESNAPDSLPLSNSKTFFEMFMRFSNLDPRKLAFANELERVVMLGSVDRYLNRRVHNFAVNESVPMDMDRLFASPVVGGAKSALSKYVATQKRVREKFMAYEWDHVKIENGCVGPPPPQDPKPAQSEIATFTPSQDFIRHFFTTKSKERGMLLNWSVGTGKCHAVDTPILMADGAIKKVQDVVVGDRIMGDNSKPREVLSLGRGTDTMYSIAQSHGDTYAVNSEHILCLVYMGDDEQVRKKLCPRSDGIIEMEVRDFIRLPPFLKDELHGYRVQVDFKDVHLVEDPYSLGYLTRTSRCIPRSYIISSKVNRLRLLKGVLDANGVRVENMWTLRIAPTFGGFAADIMFLARSLGYEISSSIDSDGTHVIVLNTTAFPDMTSKLTVCDIGTGSYYGFTLDGNNRYLLGDCTVTHNTCLAIATASSSFESDGYTILYVTRHTLKGDVWKNMFGQVCSLVMQEKIRAGVPVPEAQAQRRRMISAGWFDPLSYKQFSNMLQGKNAMFQDLVKRNPGPDPLRKTLVIIDEAHKLFAPDVAGSEKPDVDTIRTMIHNSYAASGKDSVRVLLMTATPYTDDPMDMMRLLNLTRKSSDQLPEEFDAFAEKYLDAAGVFHDMGKAQFLDDIAGTISYLNREKDIRSFSYPIFREVAVPLSDYTFAAELKKFLYDRTMMKGFEETISNTKAYQKEIYDNQRREQLSSIETMSEVQAMKRILEDCAMEVERTFYQKNGDINAAYLQRLKDCKDDEKECKEKVKEKYKTIKNDLKAAAKVATKSCGKDKECKANVASELKSELARLKQDEKFDMSECTSANTDDVKRCRAAALAEHNKLRALFNTQVTNGCVELQKAYTDTVQRMKTDINKRYDVEVQRVLDALKPDENKLKQMVDDLKTTRDTLDAHIVTDKSQRKKLETCLKVKPAHQRIISNNLPKPLDEVSARVDSVSSVMSAVDSAKTFLISGHGGENMVNFNKRVRVPKDKVLVVFPVCGRLNWMSNGCRFVDMFNDPAMKKWMRDPIKYFTEITGALGHSMHVYLPGDMMPMLTTNLFLNFEKKSVVVMKSGVFRSKVPLLSSTFKPEHQNQIGANCEKYIGSVDSQMDYSASMHREVFKGNVFADAGQLDAYNRLVHRSYKLSDIIDQVGPGIYYYIGCRAADKDLRASAYERLYDASAQQQNAEGRLEKMRDLIKLVKVASPSSPSSQSSPPPQSPRPHISPPKPPPPKPTKGKRLTKQQSEMLDAYITQADTYTDTLMSDQNVATKLAALDKVIGETLPVAVVKVANLKLTVFKLLMIANDPNKYYTKIILKTQPFVAEGVKYLRFYVAHEVSLVYPYGKMIVAKKDIGCIPSDVKIPSMKCSVATITATAKALITKGEPFELPATPEDWDNNGHENIMQQLCVLLK